MPRRPTNIPFRREFIKWLMETTDYSQTSIQSIKKSLVKLYKENLLFRNAENFENKIKHLKGSYKSTLRTTYKLYHTFLKEFNKNIPIEPCKYCKDGICHYPSTATIQNLNYKKPCKHPNCPNIKLKLQLNKQETQPTTPKNKKIRLKLSEALRIVKHYPHLKPEERITAEAILQGKWTVR